MRRTRWMVMAALAGTPAAAVAQATGMPSFNAPYRAFARHEFGAAVSFSDFDGRTAAEGMYRFASGAFDVGVRGGLLFSDGALDSRLLAGVEARYRVITHTVDFPLDGALLFGGGLQVDGGTDIWFPVGLSLGRRLDVQNSQVSIVPYAQPTAAIVSADLPAPAGRDTDIIFGLGLGADFRLSRAFDARVSIGLGDIEGISIAAVWIR
jgi:hypothetical protein